MPPEATEALRRAQAIDQQIADTALPGATR
jgi:hypothetical protein